MVINGHILILNRVLRMSMFIILPNTTEAMLTSLLLHCHLIFICVYLRQLYQTASNKHFT